MAYGLKIYGVNGTSVVFDETILFSRLSYFEEYNIGKSATKTYSWPEANNREKYQIIVVPYMTNDILSGAVPEQALYSTYFTLTNPFSAGNAKGYLYILRRT